MTYHSLISILIGFVVVFDLVQLILSCLIRRPGYFLLIRIGQLLLVVFLQ